jgi:hypothetical protein
MKKLLQSLFVLLFVAVTAMAQDRTVTGTVTAKEDGLPLPGVSVKVKGSTAGTQTGADGKFTLKVPQGESALTFTFIGYVAKTVNVGASSTVNVTLEADTKMLSEVVVTSFGIQRDKKSLGYGTSTVSAEDLTTAKVTNCTW